MPITNVSSQYAQYKRQQYTSLSTQGTTTTTPSASTPEEYIAIGIQPYNDNLYAIANLTGTSGVLRKTAQGVWTLDTTPYLTSITSQQVITALGYTPQDSSQKGVANGYASLDTSGLVPASQLPSYVDDVLEYANQASFPSPGVTGKIYVDVSTSRIYRWSGSTYIEVSPTVGIAWGGITGTLANQTDLQLALDSKVPTSRTLTINGVTYDLTGNRTWSAIPAGGLEGYILAKVDESDYNVAWIENYATQTKHEVKLGEAMSAGTAVYVTINGNGSNMTVLKASNTSEATSSKTLGIIQTGGVLNDIVKVVTEGLLSGINTSTATAGDPIWLGPNGTLLFGLANKPSAPNHLVYLGVVTRVHAQTGEIFVHVQNGFELDELHDISLVSKLDNQGIFYEASTGLWKNKSIATVLGYTPYDASNPAGYITSAALSSYVPTSRTITINGTTYDLSANRTWNITSMVYPGAGIAVSTGTGWGTSITDNSANWNTAYSWGNHASAGYLLASTASSTYLTISNAASTYLTSATAATTYQPLDADLTAIAGLAGTSGLLKKTAANTWTLDTNTYLTSYTEIDPTVGSHIKAITSTQISNWDTAYGWGNHASAGYLTTSTASTTYVPQTRTITINGTTYDLTANRSWTVSAGSSALSGLSDVTITSVANGQLLQYNSTSAKWVNWTPNYLTSYTETDTLASVTGRGATTTATITANGFIKSGGTSSQFLKADGSVDSSTYATTSSLGSYVPLSGGTMTGGLTFSSATTYTPLRFTGGVADYTVAEQDGAGRVNWYWNKAGTGGSPTFQVSSEDAIRLKFNTSQAAGAEAGIGVYYAAAGSAGGAIVWTEVMGAFHNGFRVLAAATFSSSVTANSFVKSGGTSSQFLKADGSVDSTAYYAASNPSGYTTNTGTVTSVSGTGTVSGLTLTGTVTTSGSLTLGGTLSLTSGQVTTALGYTPYNSTNPSGYITSSSNITGTSGGVSVTLTGTSATNVIYAAIADNDFARIRVGADASNAGWMEIATADDGTEPIYVRQYTGVFTSVTRTATLLDGSGNTSFPGSVTASSFSGSISSSMVTTALGYTPYNSTNPNGYTSNTGTVTSVSGTGTVSGLTLTGTVTTSGSLTLGGTLSLTSANVTTALGYTPYNSTNPNGYTSNAGTVTSVSGTGSYGGLTLTGTVTTSGSLTLGGTPSGTWPISVSGSAVTLSTTRSNWSTNGTISAVVGQLSWKNYGNNHTIFDASAGTSPDGGAVNNTNSAVAWTGTYPTLMGWNGSSTYGVRVDSARIADSASSVAWTNVSGRPTTVSSFTNDSGYITNTNAAYNVTAGEGNGVYFWQDSTNYTIKMGYTAGTYQYGPVTDYSMRFTMGAGTGRGFTWGYAGASPTMGLNANSGNLQIAGTFTEASSVRYKDNIADLTYTLEDVLKLRSVTYTKKGTDHIELGFIAEEVNEIIPEAVMKNEDGSVESISYGRLTAVLLNAVKDQQKQIEELKELLNQK